MNFVEIDPSWDYLMIPSNRPLHAIFADIVQHGVDHPNHGTDCSCMDQYSYEIKAHLHRALPEVQRFKAHEANEWGDGWIYDDESRSANFAARMRISHVLGMVVRSL